MSPENCLFRKISTCAIECAVVGCVEAASARGWEKTLPGLRGDSFCRNATVSEPTPAVMPLLRFADKEVRGRTSRIDIILRSSCLNATYKDTPPTARSKNFKYPWLDFSTLVIEMSLLTFILKEMIKSLSSGWIQSGWSIAAVLAGLRLQDSKGLWGKTKNIY